MNSADIPAESQALAQEIFALCLQITSQGQYWAFCSLAAHVGWIEVRICKPVGCIGSAEWVVDRHDYLEAGMLDMRKLKHLRDCVRKFEQESSNA